jgi:cytochrome P450
LLPTVWKDPLQFFVNAAREYGRVVQLDLGPRHFYLISHPDDVKYVLQDNNRNFTKRYGPVKPLLGEGLVTSTGDLWLRQRRLMQPAFHRQKIAALSGMMTAATEEMLTRWDANPPGRPLDVGHEMMMLTQAIIVRTMFSTDVSAEAPQLSQAFEVTLDYFNHLTFSPIRVPLAWPTPRNLRFKRANQFIEDTVYRIIHDRRRSGREENDLLSMLVWARDEETGEGMPDRQIRDEVVTIFLAGHETTATTLSWAWYLLAQHPNVRQKIESELDSVLGGRTPVFEDLARLTYTRLIIDETLRLYPPAWMFVRTAVADDEIAEYRIPADAPIFISPYVSHRLPEFWPEPERFDPERFRPEAVEVRHKSAYFPFAAGPRKCLGDQFALVEATLLLAMIAQRYRLPLAPNATVKPAPRATLKPQPGVVVTLQRR